MSCRVSFVKPIFNATGMVRYPSRSKIIATSCELHFFGNPFFFSSNRSSLCLSKINLRYRGMVTVKFDVQNLLQIIALGKKPFLEPISSSSSLLHSSLSDSWVVLRAELCNNSGGAKLSNSTAAQSLRFGWTCTSVTEATQITERCAMCNRHSKVS